MLPVRAFQQPIATNLFDELPFHDNEDPQQDVIEQPPASDNSPENHNVEQTAPLVQNRLPSDDALPSNAFSFQFVTKGPVRVSDLSNLDTLVVHLDQTDKMRLYSKLLPMASEIPEGIKHLRAQLNIKENRKTLQSETQAAEKIAATAQRSLAQLEQEIEKCEKIITGAKPKVQRTHSYQRTERRLQKLYEERQNLYKQLAEVEVDKLDLQMKQLNIRSNGLLNAYFTLAIILSHLDADQSEFDQLQSLFRQIKELDPCSLAPYYPLFTCLASRYDAESLHRIVSGAYQINPAQTYALILMYLQISETKGFHFPKYDKPAILNILKELYPGDKLVQSMSLSPNWNDLTYTFPGEEYSKAVGDIVADKVDCAISSLADLTNSLVGCSTFYRYLAFAWILKGDSIKALEIFEKSTRLLHITDGHFRPTNRLANTFFSIFKPIFSKTKGPKKMLDEEVDYLADLISLLKPGVELNFDKFSRVINAAHDHIKASSSELPLVYMGLRALISKLFVSGFNFDLLHSCFLALFELMGATCSHINDPDEWIKERFIHKDGNSYVDFSKINWNSELAAPLPDIQFTGFELSDESRNAVAIALVKDLYYCIFGIMTSHLVTSMFEGSDEKLPLPEGSLWFQSGIYQGFNTPLSPNGEIAPATHQARYWKALFKDNKRYPIDPHFLEWASFCSDAHYPEIDNERRFSAFLSQVHRIDKSVGKDSHLVRLAFRDASRYAEDGKIKEMESSDNQYTMFKRAQSLYQWKADETFRAWGDRLNEPGEQDNNETGQLVNSIRHGIILKKYLDFWAGFQRGIETKNDIISGQLDDQPQQIDQALLKRIVDKNRPEDYPGYKTFPSQQQKAIREMVQHKHRHAEEVSELKKNPLSDPAVASAILLWASEFERNDIVHSIYVRNEETAKQVAQILLKVGAERLFRKAVISGKPSIEVNQDYEQQMDNIFEELKRLEGTLHGPEVHLDGDGPLQLHYNAAAVSTNGSLINTHIYFD